MNENANNDSDKKYCDTFHYMTYHAQAKRKKRNMTTQSLITAAEETLPFLGYYFVM